jgi:hypothetical protein
MDTYRQCGFSRQHWGHAADCMVRRISTSITARSASGSIELDGMRGARASMPCCEEATVLAGIGKSVSDLGRKQSVRDIERHPRWSVTAGSRDPPARHQRTRSVRLGGSRSGPQGWGRQPDLVFGEGLPSRESETRDIEVPSLVHYLA